MSLNNLPYRYYNYAPPVQQQPITGGLKGRPVSSLEEVRAASIDFDGTVFFFPDLINQRIYTKQINLDGTARFNVYELGELPVVKEDIDTSKFITKQDLDAALNNLLDQMTAPKKGDKKKNESVRNTDDAEEGI